MQFVLVDKIENPCQTTCIYFTELRQLLQCIISLKNFLLIRIVSNKLLFAHYIFLAFRLTALSLLPLGDIVSFHSQRYADSI